jgi:hypothetical protein
MTDQSVHPSDGKLIKEFEEYTGEQVEDIRSSQRQ